MKYANDQAAYKAGADAGRAGTSWTSATLSPKYPDSRPQKRAFLEGFEYGEYYRLGESGGMTQDAFNPTRKDV